MTTSRESNLRQLGPTPGKCQKNTGYMLNGTFAIGFGDNSPINPVKGVASIHRGCEDERGFVLTVMKAVRAPGAQSCSLSLSSRHQVKVEQLERNEGGSKV